MKVNRIHVTRTDDLYKIRSSPSLKKGENKESFAYSYVDNTSLNWNIRIEDHLESFSLDRPFQMEIKSYS
ncbi:hypothetical protein RIR_jg41340.t1 [Rhizophagus irregularis DAOM 181602=DAOM 197198]|nr:hypothetical protein RIR_jg41340.t1 [Rhizophagus irregularis DAOM 181602=DAOM 197198]